MRVSVGIPFHNAERTLADAIRSVFAQSMDDWELILLDDGSTDGSLDIARSVDDPRVRVISDGENLGLQSRLNQMANLARSRYLARMDADDIMHPDRLETQARCLDEQPELDVVGCGVYTIDGERRPTGVRALHPLDTRPRSVPRHGLMIHPSVMGRTEWFRRNPYNESFRRAEDYELWCRTCATSRFAKVSRPLLYYREDYRDPESYARYYASDAVYCRKCLKLHGPRIVGWPETVYLILRTYAKASVYRAATRLGAQSALFAKRNRPMDDREIAEAVEGLGIVMNTPVPGLAEVGVGR